MFHCKLHTYSRKSCKTLILTWGGGSAPPQTPPRVWQYLNTWKHASYMELFFRECTQNGTSVFWPTVLHTSRHFACSVLRLHKLNYNRVTVVWFNITKLTLNSQKMPYKIIISTNMRCLFTCMDHTHTKQVIQASDASKYRNIGKSFRYWYYPTVELNIEKKIYISRYCFGFVGFYCPSWL